MVKKKARLGRGLGALLGDVKATTQVADQADKVSTATVSKDTNPSQGKVSVTGLKELAIDQLQRGEYQPRMKMDKEALAELGESIKSQGVLQPLLVRPIGKSQYEIIAGERRWRGAQLAGLENGSCRCSGDKPIRPPWRWA